MTNVTHGKISEIEKRLESLHLNQTNKPTAEGIDSRRKLQARLNTLRTNLQPPRASRSLFTHLKEECMSRQFWRSAFSGTRSSSMIECLKVVTNWSVPPDKDDATTPTTPQVAQAAADYQSHLGSLPVPTNATETATLAMLSELEKWGVEAATSDEIGADITDEEVEAVCAILPVGKAPDPDRIPNEFYKRILCSPCSPPCCCLQRYA